MIIPLRNVPVTRRARGPGLLSTLAIVCAFAWACALEGCVSDGPSTETGNPNLDGTLLNEHGRPISGSVMLYRYAGSGSAADTSLAAALIQPALIKSVSVGADGKFAFDSLAAGRYGLKGADASGGNIAWAAGLALESRADTLHRLLIVKPPARFLGKVTRGPDALPAGVDRDKGILINVGGTDRFAYSDTAGNYSIDMVPVGVWRVAFAAPDGHYEPKALDSVRASPGETLTLPTVELEWSRYAAPPEVAGLRARIDSAAGTVRLDWKPVRLANLAHYELVRRDSLDPANDAVFLATDTLFTDTPPASAAGHTLAYRVTAVNALGNRGPDGSGSAGIVTAPTPVDPDAGGDTTLALAGVVLEDGLPRAGARVRLYSVPAEAGSPDSLRVPLASIDSISTGADGRYRFAKLPPGTYTVAASLSAGGPGTRGDKAAVRIGLRPRLDAAPPGTTALDTLATLLTGAVQGKASRDSLWVSAPFKGDENILAGIAGAPYQAFTGYADQDSGGPFTLNGIPPGTYRLVIQPGPQGFFLPETVSVSVASGATTLLPAVIKARYNPKAPPPKISSLAITAGSRTAVDLAWSAVTRYSPLLGYRVLRLDGDSRETARSGVITATRYRDDVSALASGAKVFYVVKVVNQAGVEGEAGGDGNPMGTGVPFTVPSMPSMP